MIAFIEFMRSADFSNRFQKGFFIGGGHIADSDIRALSGQVFGDKHIATRLILNDARHSTDDLFARFAARRAFIIRRFDFGESFFVGIDIFAVMLNLVVNSLGLVVCAAIAVGNY